MGIGDWRLSCCWSRRPMIKTYYKNVVYKCEWRPKPCTRKLGPHAKNAHEHAPAFMHSTPQLNIVCLPSLHMNDSLT